MARHILSAAERITRRDQRAQDRADRAAAADTRREEREAASAAASTRWFEWNAARRAARDGNRGADRLPDSMRDLPTPEPQPHLVSKRKRPIVTETRPGGNYAMRRARGQRGHHRPPRRRELPAAVMSRRARGAVASAHRYNADIDPNDTDTPAVPTSMFTYIARQRQTAAAR